MSYNGAKASDILKENHEVRARRGAGSKSFGQALLQIPMWRYRQLKASNPELSSNDPEVVKKAWERFANSLEGRLYKVAQERKYVRGSGNP